MGYDSLERSDSAGSKVELYLFETDGGYVTKAYTTAAQSITVMGQVFEPEAISRGELRQSMDASSSERITITVPYDNPIALLHVPYLPPRPVRVRIFSYHRHDALVEVVQGFVGYISNFRQVGERFEMQAVQLTDTMQQLVAWMPFKKGCVHATYGPGCGLNRENFKTIGTVASFAATTIEITAAASRPNDYFTAGHIENPATGEIRFVTAHTGNLIKVHFPFLQLANNDTLWLFAGDDHQPETCRVKFNNKANYLGFDRFPTFNVFRDGTYGTRGSGGGFGGGNGGGGTGGGGTISLPPVSPNEPPRLPPTNTI